MNVLLAGIDGYIGWTLMHHLKNRGHSIVGMDNFLRRRMVEEVGSDSIIPIADIRGRMQTMMKSNVPFYRFDTSDDTNYYMLKRIFRKYKFDCIVNLAQQPSAPYSMIDIHHANFTQRNNIQGLMNILWAMHEELPKSHCLTLGTMGEYETPNMPIPEGFFEIEFEGMKDILHFPRLGHSFYHLSKTHSTHNAFYACKVWDIFSTDVHQGVTYGTRIEDINDNPDLKTRFDVDECFGTMINRACACAIIGHPILVYGIGEQTRGYIALRDSIQCLTLAMEKPPTDEDSIRGYRVLNQFDESYSCNQLAETVQKVASEKFGLETEIKHIENPRVEKEVHYFNPHHEKLYKMGFRPTKTLKEELEVMFEDLIPCRDRIFKYRHKLLPTVNWRNLMRPKIVLYTRYQ